jgi:hypothetical protein
MPLVVVRGTGIASVLLRPGETLRFGRAPGSVSGAVTLTLPECAPHVSRLVGELVVGVETVTLNWLGSGEAQLSSLFDAPGGARRVIMIRDMSVLLDDGENQLVLLLGRQVPGGFADLQLTLEVKTTRPEPDAADAPDDTDRTAAGPRLEKLGREWFVALALTEPWLTGRDDYPRPPSNKEIFERVRYWRGYAWNLQQPQWVDEAIKAIAALAFGPRDDPYRAPHDGRLQNVRFMVAQRAAELRLVTAAELAEVERAARSRKPR